MADQSERASPDLIFYFERVYFERGAGPPPVLVHGLMVTGAMFEPVIGALAQSHRLVIPDLRGSGESRHLPPPYAIKQQAADHALVWAHPDDLVSAVARFLDEPR